MNRGREVRAGVPMISAMKSASNANPRPASDRRAASTNTHSVSMSVPSRSKTTPRTGRRSLFDGAAVIRVDVREGVLLDRLDGQLAGAVVGGPADLGVQEGGGV